MRALKPKKANIAKERASASIDQELPTVERNGTNTQNMIHIEQNETKPVVRKIASKKSAQREQKASGGEVSHRVDLMNMMTDIRIVEAKFNQRQSQGSAGIETPSQITNT